MIKHHFYIVFILTLFAVTDGIGQNRNIEYISAEQGLSQNEVSDILQDSKGFMWFATRGGINRYDGYEFSQFNTGSDEEYNLTNPSIECIFEDSKDNLWIGTKSGGLNFFDYEKEKFIHIQYFGSDSQLIRDNRIVCIDEATNGNMLLGSWSNGLYILDKQNDKLHHHIEQTRIYSILVSEDNFVWLGTNSGLFKLNLENNFYEKVEFENEFEVTDIIFDSDKKNIWIAGWEAGLTRLNIETQEYQRFSLNPDDLQFKSSQNSTYSLLLDTSGKLWIGTWNGGLYQFNSNNNKFEKVKIRPSNQSELNSNFDIILDIFEDKDNNIWIGTDSGGLVFIGPEKSFQGISSSKNPDCGLQNFYITAIFETPDKTLWVGTRGGGLYKTNDKKRFEKIPIENENFESLIIKFIYPVSDEILCVCTGQDVFYVDLTKRHVLKPLEDEILTGIKKILTIRRIENHLFLGTQQSGFYSIQNYFGGEKELIHFDPKNNDVLKNERITFIERDLNNTIWVGTYKGVYLYDIQKKSLKNVELSDGKFLNSEMIYSWEQTTDSTVWLGTPLGLIQLVKTKDNNYSSRYFYNEKEFPYNYVRHILSDNENNIWLSTSSGLVKMNINNNSMTSFDNTDGWIDLNYSEDIGYKNMDGTLYFGGANGFFYFEPKTVKTNKNIPPLVFTKFRIFNQEIKPLQKIGRNVVLSKSICLSPALILTYKERDFSIEYAALNYNASQKNKYKYKLEGYDSDWILASSSRTVSYSNLKGGNYRFLVKCSNGNDLWSEKPLVLEIKITKAPWETWYAIFVYVVLILGIVLLIIRNSVKQVKLTNGLEMEKLKSEQEHQLNEMKSRFFTNISHEFRTPLTLIMGPVKEILAANPDNQKLKVAYKNSKRLMGLVNQLLEFRRVEKDIVSLKVTENNVIDFVNEICMSFDELANVNEIGFEKQFDIKDEFLWFDIEKIEIALYNIIYNAFKYAGVGSKVKVLVNESDDYIQFHIIDNGPGIAESELDKVFDRFYQSKRNRNYGSSGIGLNLTKNMVELHSGDIFVESIPNEKTVFTVKLRKGKSHFPDDAISDSQFLEASYSTKSRLFSQLKNKTTNQTDKKELSLLIVDDNAEIRTYLNELFKNRFNITEAANGLMGYNSALENEFDMIISDIMMPVMDGMEMCRKLKSDIKSSHIPIIMLTAKSAGQFRIEGLEYGADAYISKPFDPDELIAQVHSILASRQKAKERYSKTINVEPSALEIVPFEEKFLKKVIEVIENNLENAEFTSEELAESVGMSTSTLYRKLKSLVGQSSNELIRSIRLKRAAQLILGSNETISSITYSVGFNDVKYFRKSFQKQFGKTPNQYRKDHNSL